MKRIKPQHFLILLLVAAIAAAPFLIRGLIDRSSVGKQPAAAVTAAPEETAAEVYITVSGKKYHRGSCAFLKKSKIGVTLQDAKSRGYTPCSKCKPPQ